MTETSQGRDGGGGGGAGGGFRLLMACHMHMIVNAAELRGAFPLLITTHTHTCSPLNSYVWKKLRSPRGRV